MILGQPEEYGSKRPTYKKHQTPLYNKVYKKDYKATIGFELSAVNFKIDNKILKQKKLDSRRSI